MYRLNVYECIDKNNYFVEKNAYGYEFVKLYDVTSLSPCLYNMYVYICILTSFIAHWKFEIKISIIMAFFSIETHEGKSFIALRKYF